MTWLARANRISADMAFFVTKNAILAERFLGGKNSHQEEQVHDQEDAISPCDKCISTLGPNFVEPVTILSLAKLSFNRNTLAIFLPTLCFQTLQFIFVFKGTLWRTLRWLACEAGMIAFQIG